MSITLRQIEWTAGFLEGEGSFLYPKTPTVSAAQVQLQPLDKLQKLFGGKIWHWKARSTKHSDISVWSLASSNGAALMMTLYILMSPKRQQQIINALEKWKAAPGQGRRPWKKYCYRGHDKHGRRSCHDCARVRRAKYRKRIRIIKQASQARLFS